MNENTKSLPTLEDIKLLIDDLFDTDQGRKDLEELVVFIQTNLS